ncbi:MAG TPA: DUF3168 domain-containing protein [Alphaproteobacteria bacterium]|nr:DUF3168 domain-containing protein [Alphaproteobacteria bacterium]
MTASLFAAQEAVFDTLLNNAALQALIGNPARLYDLVPPDALFPYITLGDVVLRDFDVKDRTGFEQTLLLHAWSRYRGRKEVKSIMQAVYDALHRASLSVSGADAVSIQFLNAAVSAQNDGLTLHGVMRFRLVVQH